jgi:hypothetical protein
MFEFGQALQNLSEERLETKISIICKNKKYLYI